MSKEYIMTAECVSEGHPDKLADQISDAVLDEYIRLDPNARVACECLLAERLVVIAGEISSSVVGMRSIADIAREVIKSVGYNENSLGFSLDELEVVERIHSQAEEIFLKVGRDDSALGAGDQGIMVGYACDETPEMMPLSTSLSQRFIARLTQLRQNREISWLRPDAKSQVSVRYFDERPADIDTVVVSTQHESGFDLDAVREAVSAQVVIPVLEDLGYGPPKKLMVNPSGPFTSGGPGVDTGLTGRKVVVDAYGPFCPVGGGAFSGKDATKVDRSGAYMARHIAKSIVAAGMSQRCTIHLAYVIGYSQPIAVTVNSHGTSEMDDLSIGLLVADRFDCSVGAIIEYLDLRKPKFYKTARYGHFGFGAEDQRWEEVARLTTL